MKASSKRSNNLQGIVTCPGDKSISQRSVIIGSLLDEDIQISGFLFAEDPLSTIGALRNLGHEIEIDDDTVLIKNSIKHISDKKVFCDLGNSGTGFRLISGLIVSQGINAELTGDDSLCKRPMSRIINPLNEMGAKIESNKGCAPLIFTKAQLVKEFLYEMPIASAQLKSCLLLAAISSNMKLTVRENKVSRDHTERMLEYFGANITTKKLEVGQEIILHTNNKLKAKDYSVVGDFSSASFLIVAALITKDSSITIKNVGINETRFTLIEILKKMGADINIKNHLICCGEEVADIEVSSSALNGISIEEECIPKIIDEIPILSIAASFAEGQTSITGAGELRFKESDRLMAIEEGLKKIGVSYESSDDSIVIMGNRNLNISKEVNIDSFDDHRIAMSFLIAGLRFDSEVHVNDCKNIDTSFPSFFRTFSFLGAKIKTA